MRLGDIVFYITKYTGIKAIVDWYSKVTGKDCGCEERRKEYNKIGFRSSDED